MPRLHRRGQPWRQDHARSVVIAAVQSLPGMASSGCRVISGNARMFCEAMDAAECLSLIGGGLRRGRA